MPFRDPLENAVIFPDFIARARGLDLREATLVAKDCDRSFESRLRRQSLQAITVRGGGTLGDAAVGATALILGGLSTACRASGETGKIEAVGLKLLKEQVSEAVVGLGEPFIASRRQVEYVGRPTDGASLSWAFLDRDIDQAF